MNRNHIDDRWRQCHWEEWREIKKRWNQVRKTGEEPNRQSERVKAAELEGRAQLSPSSGTGCNATTFGSWSGSSHSFSPVRNVSTTLRHQLRGG
jgi:hypothetical protein